MNLKNFREKNPGPQKMQDSMMAQMPPIIAMLNSLLAEEYQAWYQYHSVSPFLVGNERTAVTDLFKANADDELSDHANKLLNRINELCGECYLTTPDSWKTYAQSQFAVTDFSVMSQLMLNRQAEMQAIEHYRQVIVEAESIQDFTTAEVLKQILSDEEEHLSKLNDLIKDIQNG